MNEADLLLVLGASFSNHTGIYAGHPIIQVDFDPMQLGKFHPVDGPGLGRGRRRRRRACARELPRATRDRPTSARRRRRALGDLARREGAAAPPTTAAAASTRPSVFAAMKRQIPDDAVIAVDVGNHAYSFGRYFECKRPQRC